MTQAKPKGNITTDTRTIRPLREPTKEDIERAELNERIETNSRGNRDQRQQETKEIMGGYK